MTDTDSYLLKCTLDAMTEGVAIKDIQEACERQINSADYAADISKQPNNLNNGER